LVNSGYFLFSIVFVFFFFLFGRDLPYEPAKIFPRRVRLSPFPIRNHLAKNSKAEF